MTTVSINKPNLLKFKHVKSFQPQEKDCGPVTSLNFDDNGQFLLTSSSNDTMQLYSATNCKFLDTIASKKYGCHSAIFTHAQNECIYSSTMKNFDIKYLNLETNQYLRYFSGHGALVNDLKMNPVNDTFLSSSYDESVRLWDLKISKPQVIIPSLVPNCIAYDPSGIVFALGNPENFEIGLYNLKKIQEGPFLIIKINDTTFSQWNKLEFSNNGKYLLVGSSIGKHLIFDAFTGQQLFELIGTRAFPMREFLDSGSACFTPDGEFVLGTDYDGRIAIWNHSDSISNKVLRPQGFIPCVSHETCPRSIAFNPKYSMFVTADETVDFYVYDE